MSTDPIVNEAIDLNEVSARVINHQIKDFLSAVTGPAKNIAESMRARIPLSLEKYLNRMLPSISRTRTLLSGESPAYIYDFFVPLNISTGEERLRAPSFSDISKFGNFLLITGSGGSGKSIMMKHLCLDCARHNIGLPIFYELREVNDTDDPSLLDLLLSHLSLHHLDIGSKSIQFLLDQGRVALFFDGFDEVSTEYQGAIEKQINALAIKYPAARIIVSSREDERLSAWPSFIRFRPDALDEEQAIKLISRLHYNHDISQDFIENLQSGLFDRYSSIISTPLMLIIMLLTFQDSAGVPDKEYLFYAHAYDALLRRHDATKTGFVREIKSGLSVDEFKHVISAIAYASYQQEKFHFTIDEYDEYARFAKLALGIEYDSRHLLHDLRLAACLIVKDGLRYKFVHRSFQEYFAAVFVRNAKANKQKMLIEELAKRTKYDNALRLLWEMDQALVEEHFVIPALNKLRSKLSYRGRMYPVVRRRLMEHFGIELTFIPRGDSSRSSLVWIARRESVYNNIQFIVSQYFDIPARTSENKRAVSIIEQELRSIAAGEGREASGITIDANDVYGNAVLNNNYDTAIYWPVSGHVIEPLLELLSELELRHRESEDVLDAYLS